MKPILLIFSIVLCVSRSFAGDWFEAAQAGDVATLRNFLKQGTLINSENEKGETALMHAVVAQKMEAVKFLVSSPGVDLNLASREEGLSSLMIAAHLNFNEILSVLIGAGALIDQKDIRGQGALVHAIKASNLDGVKALIAAGCEFDSKDIFDKSAIDWANETGNIELAAVIREEKFLQANPTLALRKFNLDSSGKALREQALLNQARMIGFLLKAGVDVNDLDEMGLSALDLSMIKNAKVSVEYLKAHGGVSHDYASSRYKLGSLWMQTPSKRQQNFLQSIEQGQNDLVSLYLDAGIPLKDREVSGLDLSVQVNPLKVAIQSKNLVAIAQLLLHGDEPDWGKVLCLLSETEDPEILKAFRGWESAIERGSQRNCTDAFSVPPNLEDILKGLPLEPDRKLPLNPIEPRPWTPYIRTDGIILNNARK